ncbi:MAG: prephenate dehydratase [Verrucomicrobiota bacterium]
MPLTPIRKKIDALDAQLLALLNERAGLVHEIGEIKRQSGGSVFAPEREETLLRSLAERNASLGGRLPASAVRAIYREIMSASYALEKGLTIAYFGPAGTYTHEAARNKFGASVEYAPQASITDVFSAVARGSADFGVVPIENSTEGAVTHTLDEFMASELKICAQILLRVEQNLLAKCPRAEIRKIYSHPQSLGQCRQWLQTNFPAAEIIAASSNTRAAQHAAEEQGAAAIAGKLAAELYGLNILEASIQDCAFNTTRFLVIGPDSCPPTGNDKTSLMFTVRDESGALFAALEPFQRLGISMSKIESRPSKRKAWEYYFFVDIEGHAEDPRVVEALAELEKRCTQVKILGSYPKTA